MLKPHQRLKKEAEPWALDRNGRRKQVIKKLRQTSIKNRAEGTVNADARNQN